MCRTDRGRAGRPEDLRVLGGVVWLGRQNRIVAVLVWHPKHHGRLSMDRQITRHDDACDSIFARRHDVGARRKVGCAQLRPCLGSGLAGAFPTLVQMVDTAAAPLEGAVAVFPACGSPAPRLQPSDSISPRRIRLIVDLEVFFGFGWQEHHSALAAIDRLR